MKLLFDFLPLLLFFAAYTATDIFTATAVAIAASVCQIGWLLLRRRKIEPMLWVSVAVIVVFGGATLILQDETFSKVKPTVLYGLFAAVLLVGDLLLGRNPMKALLGSQLELPASAWRGFNLSWAGLFAFLAAANLYIAFNYPEALWVNFKVWGTTILSFIFIIGQSFWLARVMQQAESESAKDPS